MFQSRCPLHRKRESQRDVNGCDVAHNRCHYQLCSARRTSADPEWQRIGNQIDSAFIFARMDFVDVLIHALAQYQITAENGKVVVINEGYGVA